jgi:hypothetical protein
VLLDPFTPPLFPVVCFAPRKELQVRLPAGPKPRGQFFLINHLSTLQGAPGGPMKPCWAWHRSRWRPLLQERARAHRPRACQIETYWGLLIRVLTQATTAPPPSPSKIQKTVKQHREYGDAESSILNVLSCARAKQSQIVFSLNLNLFPSFLSINLKIFIHKSQIFQINLKSSHIESHIFQPVFQ